MPVRRTSWSRACWPGRRPSATPYLYIAGGDLDPDHRQWLGTHLPTATVEVWPRTGHFPHLADPRRFAQRLADTGRW